MPVPLQTARLAVFFVLILTASCGVVDAIPVGGKCHDRADGSVLKVLKDINGKQWPVVKYPTVEAFGITVDSLCAVPLEARQSAYREPTRVYYQVGSRGQLIEQEQDDRFLDKWLIHPDTGEPVRIDELGPYRGFLDISTKYEWY